jgi:hypothetical protein
MPALGGTITSRRGLIKSSTPEDVAAAVVGALRKRAAIRRCSLEPPLERQQVVDEPGVAAALHRDDDAVLADLGGLRLSGALLRTMRLLPRRVADRSAKAIKADTIMRNAAHAPERAAYEERAAGK